MYLLWNNLQQYTFEKQLATESGHVKTWTFAPSCQHFKILYCVCVCIYIYIYIYMWSNCPTLWANFPSHHFAYVNDFYNIELGHKSWDHSLIENIKHGGTGRKVLLADYCFAYIKIKPLKCKVVRPPHIYSMPSLINL